MSKFNIGDILRLRWQSEPLYEITGIREFEDFGGTTRQYYVFRKLWTRKKSKGEHPVCDMDANCELV